MGIFNSEWHRRHHYFICINMTRLDAERNADRNFFARLFQKEKKERPFVFSPTNPAIEAEKKDPLWFLKIDLKPKP